MTDPIPAISEEDATGDIAALFADIRATLGAPFVNLIWRHLATTPGMLAWTWSVVKPLHHTTALRDAASALRSVVQPPGGIGQPAFVFEAAGISANDRRVIAAMLRHYNAANAMNLLCLLVAQAILAGETPGRSAAPAQSIADHAAPPMLPRLLGLGEMAPGIASLVMELDQFGRLSKTAAVASLYRHLAHWPGFLAIVHAALSIPHATGALRTGHELTRAKAAELMRQHLLPIARLPSEPPGPGRQAAHEAIETFTQQMIARMVMMGEVMLAMLG